MVKIFYNRIKFLSITFHSCRQMSHDISSDETIFSCVLCRKIASETMHKNAHPYGIVNRKSKPEHCSDRASQNVTAARGRHSWITTEIDKHTLVWVTDQRMRAFQDNCGVEFFGCILQNIDFIFYNFIFFSFSLQFLSSEKNAASS